MSAIQTDDAGTLLRYRAVLDVRESPRYRPESVGVRPLADAAIALSAGDP